MRHMQEDYVSGDRMLILNKYNFHDWLFELKNLCLRKMAVDEFTKFAWLVRAVNNSDKRLIMRCEVERITGRRRDDDGKEEEVVIEGKEMSFTWAVERLKKMIVESNASNDVDANFELREHLKDNLKRITIAKCNFDLDEYFKRFDRAVIAVLNVGCNLSENYLKKLFANGCLGHADLKSRAAIVHLEPDNIRSYVDLKIAYSSMVQPREKATEKMITSRSYLTK